METKKCGDCIHADVCEEVETLVDFSRENPAYCGMFLDNADVVKLPKGKPGDYLEWDNGTGFKKIYCISAVMICEDCVRYDLEKFTPEVNHKNIVRIMSREQAVKEYRDRCAREKVQEELTMTAERIDGDGNA